jgi:hypothetical protein
MIKLRATWTGQKGNTYKILVEKPEGKIPLVEQRRDVRIILKKLLKI